VAPYLVDPLLTPIPTTPRDTNQVTVLQLADEDIEDAIAIR
jgi:hypothetical protein